MKKVSVKDIQKWKEAKLDELQKKQREVLRAKGRNPFFKFPEGETTITLMPDLPRENTGRFGEQLIFTIKVDGQLYDLPLRATSPLLRHFVQRISDKPVKLTVIRAGRDKSTRYSVKDAK